MGWEDLLASEESTKLILPWTGGNRVYTKDRMWKIEGELPKEHGWYLFSVSEARKASLVEPADMDPNFDEGLPKLRGYLIGNRLITDDVKIVPDREIIRQTKIVYLVEPGLERFARVVAAKLVNRLIYIRQEFPQGPEVEVEQAYQDRKESINDIPGVSPSLDLAFRWLSYQRYKAEKKAEEDRRKAEEELHRQEAARRIAELRRNVGTAEGRRALAAEDFNLAAKAALSVSGSELLDVRKGYNNNEMIVQFKYKNGRYECVVERNTLRVIDAGICLEDHLTGERGDAYFTLESLPGVIEEAIALNKLVKWRHI